MLSGVSNILCAKFFIFAIIISGNLYATELQVKHAWVREAPPGAKANAAYMQLLNPSSSPVTITSLTANCCAELMLHRTLYKNDRAIMEHVDQITVPEHSSITMEPGGLHIMLMRIKSPLTAGDIIEVQLHFANGDQQAIQLPVKTYGDQ